MTEYLEKAALVRILRAKAEIGRLSEYSVCFDNVAKMIELLPAADVAEVKHGKWIWDPNGMDWGLGTWQCSECACRNNNLPMNNRINPLVFSGSKYCPNCGAKMDLED